MCCCYHHPPQTSLDNEAPAVADSKDTDRGGGRAAYAPVWALERIDDGASSERSPRGDLPLCKAAGGSCLLASTCAGRQ
jgi:hypothetical protein